MSPKCRPAVDDGRNERAWEGYGETRPPLFSPETRELLSSRRSIPVQDPRSHQNEGGGDPPAPNKRTDERRRSARWKTDEKLLWRVTGGRRPRESRLIERSLDGLVLRTGQSDLPQVGQRICPAGPERNLRVGFRSAIVRRTKPDGAGGHLVVAEILS